MDFVEVDPHAIEVTIEGVPISIQSLTIGYVCVKIESSTPQLFKITPAQSHYKS